MCKLRYLLKEIKENKICKKNENRLSMQVREMAVAGQFYPLRKEQLLLQLNEFFETEKRQKTKKEVAEEIVEKESKERKKVKKNNEKEKATAIIVPHAGYIYSGKIAAKGFSHLKKAKTFIILSPNHTGMGAGISVSDADYWETPLGKVKVNKRIVEEIASEIGELEELAHIGEHSIEVQLPFLQYFFGEDFQIVAITIAEHSLQALKKLGKRIAEISEKEDIAVIASSDFTHFESEENAKKKDLNAIEFIEKIDVEGFHSFVERNELSICGYVAITAVMQYCKERGLLKGELLKYGSSAEATGDKRSVVAYAAIAFK